MAPSCNRGESLGRLLHSLHVCHRLDGLVLLLELGTVDNLRIAHDDSAGIEIVVERLALSQELGGEQQVEPLHAFLGIFQIEASRVAHGDGALDDHHRLGIHFQHQVYHLLHVACVEVVLHGVVVRGSRYHHEIGITVRFCAIQGGGEVQRFLRQILLYVLVLDGRLALVDEVYLLRYHVHRHYLVVLAEQRGDRKAYVACAGHGYLDILVHHKYLNFIAKFIYYINNVRAQGYVLSC